MILLLALMTHCLFSLNAQTVEHKAGANNGFRVDYTEVKDNPEFSLIKAAMDRQIQMVTEVGLSDRILTFFRHVPVRIVAGKQNFAGAYFGKTKEIQISGNLLLRLRKPTLLHEFLHAYHDQKLQDGVKNRQVIAYYDRAKQLSAYDPNSHMMAKKSEFFASAGTAYLFGVTALEPYTRAKVQKNQPAFYKYLQGLFGPEAGNYKGSLNERIEVLIRAKDEEPTSEKNAE